MKPLAWSAQHPPHHQYLKSIKKLTFYAAISVNSVGWVTYYPSLPIDGFFKMQAIMLESGVCQSLGLWSAPISRW
jgi:hypothetical protein